MNTLVANVDINKVAVIAMYHEVSEILRATCQHRLNILIQNSVNYMAKLETLAQEKNAIYLARTITSYL